jgi:hypothetical protein
VKVANSVAELDMSCDFAYLPRVNIGSGCSNQDYSELRKERISFNSLFSNSL